MTKIARLDRQIRRLAWLITSSPLAEQRVNELLDERLELMAARDRGFTERNSRRWLR